MRWVEKAVLDQAVGKKLTAGHLTHCVCSWIYRRQRAWRESTTTNDYKLQGDRQTDRQCCDHSWERLRQDTVDYFLCFEFFLCVSMRRCIFIFSKHKGAVLSLTQPEKNRRQVDCTTKPARTRQMAMILVCSWHVNIKKEAHASFIRQYKSNIKDVALFLSVITTCRFGLNHKELPLMLEGKRGLWFLTKGRQNEDQIVRLFAKLAISVVKISALHNGKQLFVDISATASNWWIGCLSYGW